LKGRAQEIKCIANYLLNDVTQIFSFVDKHLKLDILLLLWSNFLFLIFISDYTLSLTLAMIPPCSHKQDGVTCCRKVDCSKIKCVFVDCSTCYAELVTVLKLYSFSYEIFWYDNLERSWYLFCFLFLIGSNEGMNCWRFFGHDAHSFMISRKET